MAHLDYYGRIEFLLVINSTVNINWLPKTAQNFVCVGQIIITIVFVLCGRTSQLFIVVSSLISALEVLVSTKNIKVKACQRRLSQNLRCTQVQAMEAHPSFTRGRNVPRQIVFSSVLVCVLPYVIWLYCC